MIHEQPNLNTGPALVRLALVDLEYGAKRGHSILTIAQFICGTEDEVREKAAELGYSVPAKSIGSRKRKLGSSKRRAGSGRWQPRPFYPSRDQFEDRVGEGAQGR